MIPSIKIPVNHKLKYWFAHSYGATASSTNTCLTCFKIPYKSRIRIKNVFAVVIDILGKDSGIIWIEVDVLSSFG